MGGSWIVGWRAGNHVDDGLPVLLCLPPAGAGCHQFRAWQEPFSGVAQVLGVQLPGRENRWREAMPPTFEEAVEVIARELVERLRPGRPLVLFGHSFGGLIAYELARRVTPLALVVSACRPPRYWDGAGRGIVDDEDELDKLFDTDATDRALLDTETRELMLEVLRRDARLSLSYAHTPGALLPIPVHAWGATGDETVTSDQLAGWAETTTAVFRRHWTDGGHHAVMRRPEPLFGLLTDLLVGFAPVGSGRPDPPRNA
ncbi:Thioesterase [Frankia canadensis]|uniref:Thioesterase n=1 Tax=Frankia canadensis TaxID=1836972 RepID=A0A2I2L271_9ACTN|nr:alpha/beta fold hydrolase [Frankia canadensis]SNQ52014.1 Thioesterase [Frankia canadensis]SOU59304.1 Thioesterase [Frankia canadensis]